MELADQPEMNPNQSFRAETQPQFQSQYPYPQPSSAFSMDQEMNMGPDNFAANAQSQPDTSLEGGAGTQGPGQANATVNMSPAGMAPPQNAGHPYSPSGQRPSIDDSQDGGLSGGDPRRKRSKVSRACDECRRKKVRCDAAADDGTIKTCSNCVKAGLTCEYSRVPMKRGPSKGYIKELSERVQQVESLQMALTNTPGYRQSLDGSGGIYSEQPYSPDDAMSAKRNFSFSADQRSPFGGPEYHRDRIPSVGGWNSGSPHSSIFRARDRGSIAVAPDQQPVNPTSFAKPFWMQEAESEPPAKRQKMNSDELSKPELGQELLSRYYSHYHPFLPLLPNADTTLAIVGKAAPKLQHAFLATIQSLTSPKEVTEHGSSGQDKATKGSASLVFRSRHELHEFMWDMARESPELRLTEDNLVYLWTCLLMAIEAENDLTRLHDGVIPRTILIKHACDLGWNCVTPSSRDMSSGTEHAASPLYVDDFARAWHCATVLARLHALAVGSGNPIPKYHHQNFQKRVPHIHDVLPQTGAVIALAAGQLTVISCLVQDSLPPSQFGRHCDIHHRLTVLEGFDNNVSNSNLAAGNENLIGQLRLFTELTLSRYTENFHPFDIITPAAALAEALRTHLTASQDGFVYNPFHLHFFTLTTITLLEFLSESHDTDLYKMATTAIDDIKVALEQISERDHIEDEPKSSNGDAGNAESVPIRKPIHWADALLKMIERRRKSMSATVANGAENPSGSGTRIGDGTGAAIDFSLLLRHGYLNVLSQQAGQ